MATTIAKPHRPITTFTHHFIALNDRASRYPKKMRNGNPGEKTTATDNSPLLTTKRRNHQVKFKNFRISTIIISTILFVSACSNDPESTVRSGTLALDQTVTIGNALDNYKYFKNQSWTSKTDSQGRQLVDFHAEFDLQAFVGETYHGRTISATRWQEIEPQIRAEQLVFRYLAQFGVTPDHGDIIVRSSGIEMSGVDNGKPLTRRLDDREDAILKQIFANQPDSLILELLSKF